MGKVYKIYLCQAVGHNTQQSLQHLGAESRKLFLWIMTVYFLQVL